jgi:hypothetical protein
MKKHDRHHPRIQILASACHRNGICGAPFRVVIFKDREEEGDKVAILFDEKSHCAVLDIAKLNAGDIAFGSNSYRGDHYETVLRYALQA